MIDEKTSARLISALPGLAVLGLVLAIAHAFGLLAPFGRDWLSWLTITDLVAMTWVMLPFTVIGLACGVFWRSTENSAQKAKREAREESFQKSVWSLILNVIAYLLLLGPPFIAAINMQFLLALDRFLPLLLVGHLWAVAEVASALRALSECFRYNGHSVWLSVPRRRNVHGLYESRANKI